jgi:hypothetical protein
MLAEHTPTYSTFHIRAEQSLPPESKNDRCIKSSDVNMLVIGPTCPLNTLASFEASKANPDDNAEIDS